MRREREMDEEGIGVVLARASELRSKFTNCIHKATTQGDEVEEGEEKEEGEAASETLLNIRDALESLESQLSSLQVFLSLYSAPSLF